MKLNVRSDVKNIVKNLENKGLIPLSMENYVIDQVMKENL